MLGTYQPSSNTVYYDAQKGQYYTLNNGAHAGFNNYFMGNPILSGVAQGQRNYLGKNNQDSQVNSALARAQQSYNETLSGLQNNPAFNQQAMFSGLSNPMMGMNQGSFGQPTQGMYGAGRFMGGLLNSPTLNTTNT